MPRARRRKQMGGRRRRMMKRILLSSILALTIFVITAGLSLAQRGEEGAIIPLSPVAGFPNCPATARNEVFFITFAIDTGSTATWISVTNLGTSNATVTCQFLSFS